MTIDIMKSPTDDEFFKLASAMRAVLESALAYGEVRQAASTRPERAEDAEAWRKRLENSAHAYFEALIRVEDRAAGCTVGLQQLTDEGRQELLVANLRPARRVAALADGEGN